MIIVHKLVAFLIAVAFSGSVAAVSHGDFCGKCSPVSGVKCVDGDTFVFCDKNGVATSRAASCPAGQKCVNQIQICAKVDEGECRNKCKECSNGRFTCINRAAFSLCFGRTKISTVAAKCPLGKVCSTAKFNASNTNPVLEFCFDEMFLEDHEIDCFDHVAPTFVPVVLPTPEGFYPHFPIPGRPQPALVPPPIPDEEPHHFCKGKKPGKYQIINDRKCQRYYVCYLNGKRMDGEIYSCAEHSVYDPKVKKCVLPTPDFYKKNKCGSNPGKGASRTSINYMPPYYNPITYGDPLNQMGNLNLANNMHSGYQAMHPYPVPTNARTPINTANPWSKAGYFQPINFAPTLNMANPFFMRPYVNPTSYYMPSMEVTSFHQPNTAEVEGPVDQNQPSEVWDQVFDTPIPEHREQSQQISTSNQQNIAIGFGTSL